MSDKHFSAFTTWPVMMYGNADLYPAALIKAMAGRDENHFKEFSLTAPAPPRYTSVVADESTDKTTMLS